MWCNCEKIRVHRSALSSRLIHEYWVEAKFYALGIIKRRKSINNLSKATELTIWTASILQSSALTESFPLSPHFLLYIPKLAPLRLAWHSALRRSWFFWLKKILASLPQFHRLVLSARLLLFSQTCSQKPVLSWHSWTLQIPPFGLGENRLGAALRGRCRGSSPVARPARIYKSFQLTHWCQSRKERGGRKSGKQAVGFWDHFAVTHIPPFCSECLNIKNNPITVDPCSASKTQQWRLIKTERVPIPSFVFAQCVCVYVYIYIFVLNWKPQCMWASAYLEEARLQTCISTK